MKERVLFLSTTNNWILSPEDNYFHPLHLQSLRPDVNTDELYPVNACYFFEDIGQYSLTGDRLGLVEENQIVSLSPTVLAAGENFGCGSAREHAPIALKQTGINLIIAHSFNTTFRENCTNLGILTSTNLQFVEKLAAGEEIPVEEILEEFQGIEKDILSSGGLFSYTLKRLKGEIQPPEIKTQPRPMTVAEKIIAQRLQQVSGRSVWIKPGNQAFVPLDLRMSYEVFTPLMAKLLADNIPEFLVVNPESVLLFADHFVANADKADHQIHQLVTAQQQFAQQWQINLYENQGCQAEGIGHNLMIENHLLPGQLAAGTDSHSSMWGVLGALGIPIGATAMANAFLTKDTLLKVPESVKISFKGALNQGCSAKDVILSLIASLPPRQVRGKIIEFEIEGFDWPVDELSVLTCMVKEMAALTSIMVPNEKVINYLAKQRGVSREEIESMIVRSDPDAQYSSEFNVNLDEIEPMVALPNSPFNSIPISQLSERVKINKAFIGSCVGGKWEDLIRAAQVLINAKVAEGVKLIIQPATMTVYNNAIAQGLAEIFQQAGALFLPPNCGACIGQGPGRVNKEEVGISASTRNYSGRMGEGQVYLASPAVVASSAAAGYIKVL